MGNQVARAYNKLVFVGILVMFPICLVIFAFSSCNIRQRAEKRACKNGDVAQCLEVGAYYEAKQGGIIAFAMSHADTATIYYYEACKLGSSLGCDHMLSIYEHADQAKNATIELTQIADVLIDACAKNIEHGCSNLDSFMSTRDWAGVRTAQAMTSRCDAGNRNACFRLAKLHGSNSGGLHNTADVVIPLYDKACVDHIGDACDKAKAYRAAHPEIQYPNLEAR